MNSDGLVTKNVFVAGTERRGGGRRNSEEIVGADGKVTDESIEEANVLFGPPATQAVTIGSEVSCCEATAIHVPLTLPM